MAWRGVRLAVLLIIAGVLATLVVWSAPWREPLGGGPAPRNPDVARVEQYRREGNLEALAGESENPRAEVAMRAVQAMGSLGPAAVPHLERRIADARPEVREAAVVAWGRAAGELVPEAVAVAAAARTDPSVVVRATAVSVLGHCKAWRHGDVLIDAMEDPDPAVRARAAAAFREITGGGFDESLGAAPDSSQAVRELRALWPGMRENLEAYYNRCKDAKGSP